MFLFCLLYVPLSHHSLPSIRFLCLILSSLSLPTLISSIFIPSLCRLSLVIPYIPYDPFPIVQINPILTTPALVDYSAPRVWWLRTPLCGKAEAQGSRPSNPKKKGTCLIRNSRGIAVRVGQLLSGSGKALDTFLCPLPLQVTTFNKQTG